MCPEVVEGWVTKLSHPGHLDGREHSEHGITLGRGEVVAEAGVPRLVAAFLDEQDPYLDRSEALGLPVLVEITDGADLLTRLDLVAHLHRRVDEVLVLKQDRGPVEHHVARGGDGSDLDAVVIAPDLREIADGAIDHRDHRGAEGGDDCYLRLLHAVPLQDHPVDAEDVPIHSIIGSIAEGWGRHAPDPHDSSHPATRIVGVDSQTPVLDNLRDVGIGREPYLRFDPDESFPLLRA